MIDITLTIELLQAEVDRLLAEFADADNYPRLQQYAPHLVEARKARLASHQQALIILQSATTPAVDVAVCRAQALAQGTCTPPAVDVAVHAVPLSPWERGRGEASDAVGDSP